MQELQLQGRKEEGRELSEERHKEDTGRVEIFRCKCQVSSVGRICIPSETSRGNGREILDSLPEYSGKPGSVDMLPVPKFQPPYPGFEQDVLKNTIPAGGVFEEKRPWWTLKKDEPSGSPLSLLPISTVGLETWYEKDPSVFQKPPGRFVRSLSSWKYPFVFRKAFYDPIREDIETLKTLDTVHNCENRVICNTFFSGVYVLDAKGKKKTSKESNSDEKRKREKEKEKEKTKLPEIVLPQVKAPTVHVKFADEPYYLHQYSRKDRNLTNNPNHRRTFVHVEYNSSRGGGKEKEKVVKTTKRGLVFD